jgi:DNA-binding NarL/FixJ family response regulator
VEGPRSIDRRAEKWHTHGCGPLSWGRLGQIATENGQGGSILVADDDQSARDLLVTLLEGAGYATQAAASGTEAIASAERARPRLAILDVCMPGVSGYEVCRRLHDTYGETLPVIFVSGERVDAVDRAAGLLLGGDDYLVKPFSPEELLARVVSLMRRSPEPDAQPAPVLSARELQVLGLLAQGLRRKEIAGQLVISPKTVNAHLTRIYEKLGARDRVQAVIVAYRTRLLEPL